MNKIIHYHIAYYIIYSPGWPKVFYKGPKFREPKTVNFEMARTSIEESIDNFIESISVIRFQGCQ